MTRVHHAVLRKLSRLSLARTCGTSPAETRLLTPLASAQLLPFLCRAARAAFALPSRAVVQARCSLSGPARPRRS
jgi:hypothetical protein